MWKLARIGLLIAMSAAAALFSGPVALAQPLAGSPAPETVCGSPLSAAELDTIARLSDTGDLSGDALQRLTTAVERNREITEILVAHRDRRGLFGIGLDGVEQAAVMPLQNDPGAFHDREYAHAISLELLSRYLNNLHAAFTGGTVEPHWARYFELAGDCTVSGAQAAMAGYSAHLAVDLAYSIAAVRTRLDNADDYFKIVAAIAGAGDVIVDRTRDVYQADLGPLWRFYFFGEGLDLLLGKGVATKPLLVAADLGANVVIFGNGLALQDPVLREPAVLEIQALTGAADVAFQVLAQLRAL